MCCHKHHGRNPRCRLHRNPGRPQTSMGEDPEGPARQHSGNPIMMDWDNTSVVLVAVGGTGDGRGGPAPAIGNGDADPTRPGSPRPWPTPTANRRHRRHRISSRLRSRPGRAPDGRRPGSAVPDSLFGGRGAADPRPAPRPTGPGSRAGTSRARCVPRSRPAPPPVWPPQSHSQCTYMV